MLGGGLWGYSTDFVQNQNSYTSLAGVTQYNGVTTVTPQSGIVHPTPAPSLPSVPVASAPAGLNATELKTSIWDTSFTVETLAIIVAELLVGLILLFVHKYLGGYDK